MIYDIAIGSQLFIFIEYTNWKLMPKAGLTQLDDLLYVLAII